MHMQVPARGRWPVKEGCWGNGAPCHPKFRFSVWCRNSPHEMFFRNLGSFPLLVHPPLVAVAGYCCVVVGSPSSLGSEMLVVLENVCELGSSAKQDHIF